MTFREMLRGLLKAIFYGTVAAIILLGIIIGLSGPSQQERRTTARNVGLLVEEARKNRELLCLGIMLNEANTARDNVQVMALCHEVGVTP